MAAPGRGSQAHRVERRGVPVPHLVHPWRAGADLHEADPQEAEGSEVVPRAARRGCRGCALERGARAGREFVLEIPDAVRDRGHRRHGGRAAVRAEEVHAGRARIPRPARVHRKPRQAREDGGEEGGEEGEVGR